jgi:hypothetical protein
MAAQYKHIFIQNVNYTKVGFFKAVLNIYSRPAVHDRNLKPMRWPVLSSVSLSPPATFLPLSAYIYYIYNDADRIYLRILFKNLLGIAENFIKRHSYISITLFTAARDTTVIHHNIRRNTLFAVLTFSNLCIIML